MHRRRACLAASSLLVAAMALSAHAAAEGPTSTGGVLLHPSIRYAGTATAGPPTTAFCEANFHVACYQPGQVRQAYDLAPLAADGINGQRPDHCHRGLLRVPDHRS